VGQYRFVPNPMYIGVLFVLLGEAALFRSASLLMYTAAFAVFFHLFVVLYEGLQNRRLGVRVRSPPATTQYPKCVPQLTPTATPTQAVSGGTPATLWQV
jgi:Phospholipid methyltransferase